MLSEIITPLRNTHPGQLYLAFFYRGIFACTLVKLKSGFHLLPDSHLEDASYC